MHGHWETTTLGAEEGYTYLRHQVGSSQRGVNPDCVSLLIFSNEIFPFALYLYHILYLGGLYQIMS